MGIREERQRGIAPTVAVDELTLEGLTQRMRDRYSDMPAQFQTAVRYLMDVPSDVALLSMRQVAQRAGVQPATLVRLAQSLGYDGWMGLRQVFAVALRGRAGLYVDEAREVQARDFDASTALRHMGAAQAANLATLADTDPHALESALALLEGASHVHIAGFRASFAMAYALHYQYRLFRSSVTLLRGDAGGLELELRVMEPHDVLVVIGFEPYSREALRVVRAARDIGCPVLVICDGALSALALQADQVLVYRTTSPSFFPSCVAGLGLVELMVERLLARAGEPGLQRIAQAAAQLERHQAYWRD